MNETLIKWLVEASLKGILAHFYERLMLKWI